MPAKGERPRGLLAGFNCTDTMVRKIALLAASCFIVLTANAQLTITGTVLDESGQPLPGAHVQVMNTLTGVSTGQDGYFFLAGLKPVSQVLRVSYLGYEPKEVPFIPGQEIPLLIQLIPRSILTEEVTVRALRAGENTPVPYSTITREEIDRSNRILDVPYLLAMTPSVTVTSDAGLGVGYTGIRIRGTDPTRINVTINGIPLNNSESHEVYWVDVPDILSSSENIQVQRGVGTSSQGAAAFGANINLQTTAVSNKPFAEISLGGGSFNTWKSSLKTGTGLIDGHWNVDVRLTGIHTDGYIDRAFADLTSGCLSGGYFSKKNIFRINLISGYERTYQAWGGVPSSMLETNRTYNPYEYKDEVDDYRQQHAQLHWSGMVSSGLNVNLSLHYTHGSGYYEQYREEASLAGYGLGPVVIGTDTLSETDLVRRKWLDNHFFGGVYSLNFSRDRVKLTVGGGINRYLGDHYGRVIWSEYPTLAGPDYQYYFNEGDKTDLNQFIKVNYSLNQNLNLYADVQFRYIHYALAGLDDDLRDLGQEHQYPFLNPKAGLTWTMAPGHTSFASYSIAHREPKRSNFTDAAPGTEIKPESLRDLEMGYRFEGIKSLVGVTVYWMDYTDQLVLTGEINDVGAAVMVNVPDSYRLGCELSYSFVPSSRFRGDFNLTVSSNKILNFTEYVDDWDTGLQRENFIGTTDLSFSPALTSAGKLTLNILPHLDVSLAGRYVGRQFIDNTGDLSRSLDPFFVSNLVLTWNLTPAWCREISLFAQVNNLFNEEYETNAWVYSYYYEGNRAKMDGYFPQAKIHFLGGINIRF